MGVYARIEFIYVQVFIGVYSWIKFICICEYRCVCIQRVYMYVRVFWVYMHGSSLCISECL